MSPTSHNAIIEGFHHTPIVAETTWIFGLSGAGKTTFANELCKVSRHRLLCLDGDIVRGGLSKDLGFTSKDRALNIERVSHVAKMANDQGISCLVSMITPTRKLRALAKNIIGPERVRFIWINTPKEVCVERDHKGLYVRFTEMLKEADAFEEPELKEELSMCFSTQTSSIEDLAILAAGYALRFGI